MAVTSIFVSSVQKELAEERRALKAFVEGDPLLRRFFRVFLFEDTPAADRRAGDVYLREVDRCALYVGLFGNEYGFEDDEGVSPTEREFVRATAKKKTRLIFVKGAADKARHPKMAALVRKATGQLLRRRFGSTPELVAAVYASLVEHLEHAGLVRTLPFDASGPENATLADISEAKLRGFLARARAARRFVLAEDTPVETALKHMNLLDAGRPTHAAILLFGTTPQRFLPTSEVKCLHFHGTEIRKPIPSYQIYKGTVFELVDQAVDFVMSKIDRSVGTRSRGADAPVTYELPGDAVAEAIVNAVCHRDYASKASVQVMLFADRLEVWNPGELPEALTPDLLRLPHASLPHNPLIAEPLFLARYIEKAGTGTLDMIRLMGAAGLPTPEFRQDGQFVITLWRDEFTAARLDELDLNRRQRNAITTIRTEGRLTNASYQALVGGRRTTAKRDLEDLVKKGVLVATGAGRGSAYVLAPKRPGNGPNGPSKTTSENGPEMVQMAHAGGKRASARSRRQKPSAQPGKARVRKRRRRKPGRS